jgi:hypothetical protein
LEGFREEERYCKLRAREHGVL